VAAAEALEAVLARYLDRPDSGVVLDEVAGGLRLVSRPDLHGYLRRFFEVTSQSKLTMAALETLAIVAYRQPVTAPEVQELRGVNSSAVIKKLLERRLVRVAGRKEVVGKPFLYATTRDFLMHFGLKNIKELPPLEQFEELFGIEGEPGPETPELDFEEQRDREAAHLAEAADEPEADEPEADEPEAEELEAGERQAIEDERETLFAPDAAAEVLA